ncbi:tetratricopeptide repeat protein [Allopusillimonas soli]|uniref:Tetratricopeptide repeat protein n=2 Tax=Allopusillimonas soli TaxID=659016 RepID=A0A853FFE6_9BURK|nr:tetratricopeptide repeat protein [Allopusillimonas soli]TEA70285.1 tetratricopeptide repeat protein [Allopusillimonas soli]
MLLAGCSTNKTDTAWKLIRQQQEQQAMMRQQEAEDLRKNEASRPEVMLAMIREAQQQQRYFASLAYIDAYAANYGDSTELNALRAHALRMTGQPQASEQAYRALLKTSEAASGWHGLGLLAAEQGDYAKASEYLAKASALQPTNAQILNDLGYARIQSGNLAGARLPLGKAAELDPDNDKVLSNLALLLLLQGNTPQANAVMDKAQLSQGTRDQIYLLASEWRTNPATHLSSAGARQPASAQATSSSSRTSSPVVTSGDVPAYAAAQASGSASYPASPIGFHQSPLMDNHTPLVQ